MTLTVIIITFTIYTTFFLVIAIAMWGYMKVHGVKGLRGCSDDTRSHWGFAGFEDLKRDMQG